MVFKNLDNCVACGSKNLEPVLDLGYQPLANNYAKNIGTIAEYPLALNHCVNCDHAQLTVGVNPNLMFKNYLYVTGTSQTLRDYCDWFAHYTTKDLEPGKVLDIASNDGTQLDSYANLGWDTVGIEPADNLVVDYKHKLYHDFCENLDLDEKFDIITAQNVMAHTAHPVKLMAKVKQWLNPDGTAYIQTSQANMFKNGEFDTMYHEHVSFFCVKSMTALANSVGLDLVKVEITPIHGDSYVFTLKHAKKTVDEERYLPDTYKKFSDKAKQTLAEFAYAVDDYRSQGYTIVGYGAAAKGMTVLNAGKIKLDFIVDDNPIKVDHYTPGTNIPILATKRIKDIDKLVIVPLAWNFYTEIKSNCLKLRNKHETVFFKYFPEVQIEKEHIS
jgi:SAM-dependent methyltransferase